MTDQAGIVVFSDESWAVWEPLMRRRFFDLAAALDAELAIE